MRTNRSHTAEAEVHLLLGVVEGTGLKTISLDSCLPIFLRSVQDQVIVLFALYC